MCLHASISIGMHALQHVYEHELPYIHLIHSLDPLPRAQSDRMCESVSERKSERESECQKSHSSGLCCNSCTDSVSIAYAKARCLSVADPSLLVKQTRVEVENNERTYERTIRTTGKKDETQEQSSSFAVAPGDTVML